MKSENEETFYDSLEEIIEDLTESVPLYSGETPKEIINRSKKKKNLGKQLVRYQKPKKHI